MAHKILKKHYLEIDVIEATKERLRHLYRTYDKVIVNFSGGKDSTAMLYITIEVARELNQLPVEVVYIDHEIEGIGTIQLMHEINDMEEVDLKWFCMPFDNRNAASMYAPKWYAWHPEERQLWTREMPDCAITDIEGFYFEYDKDYEHPDGLPFKANGVKRCITFGEIIDFHRDAYKRQGMNVISLVGIRAQESLARFGVMSRKANECYISSATNTAYPIYDWMVHDVWKYIRETELPYNVEYDYKNQTEHYNKLNKQRIGAVFAEESLRSLHQWREIYGDYWHKILERAEGIKTAWRYCNDGIYTGSKVEKEEGVTWAEYTKLIISKMSKENRSLVKKSLGKVVKWHENQTAHPISDEEKDSCPLTGISWEFLCKVAVRGDWKERQLQKVPVLAIKARERAGITRDEAVIKYGKPEYIEKYFKNKNGN